MKTESLFALAREFAFARRTRELALQAGLDAYCKEHPELLALRAQLSRARVQAARAAMAGEASPADAAEAAFDEKLRETLLQEVQDPERFAYHPRCELCDDTGVTGEGEQSFCRCLRREYAARLKLAGAVDPAQSFDVWRQDYFLTEPGERGYSEQQYMQRLKEQLMLWCENFAPGASRGLRLVGSTGCGKTFALHCVANALCERGYSAVVTRAYELNRMAAATFSADWQESYLACDFLVIDDLGAEPLYRKITAELFFSILETRRSAGLPTAIATNLTDEELEDRYGSRFYSRLIDRNTTVSYSIPVHDLRRDIRK